MNQTIQLPPLREGREAAPELAALRAQMRAGAAAGNWKTRRPALETSLAGLRTLRFAPEGKPRARMLQLHGGGFRIGMPEFESFYAEALAERLGIEVVVPQYRLAPEGPFPAGLVDARDALAALAAEEPGLPLLLGGDSAGGGLAASLALLVGATGGPDVAALVILSPWLDLRVCAPSYDANAASDPMFSRAAASAASELYLQGFDPAHPLVSPLLASIAAFPPCLISVGTGEVLADDSLRFHEKLLAAGLRSELCAVAGMEHVAVVRGLTQPGAPETLEAVVRFIGEVLQS